jgi:transcriptional regulator of arginine metabolism
VKVERLSAIKDVLAHSLVSSQDELRRKLRRRGIQVTQATLSRDMHELKLFKGPSGYTMPNGNGHGSTAEADEQPSLAEMVESFALRVKQAMNQVVMSTGTGGAQPVAAAMDRAEWSGVLGTIAGDDTVLIICADVRRAGEVAARLKAMLEA